MKIIVSSSNGGLEDSVCQIFGRCPVFTLVETSKKKITGAKIITNNGCRAGGGAGIAAAQSVIDAGAEAVITGSCGPNAIRVLNQAGIKVYASTGTVKEAVESLLAGKLSPAVSVTGHFGMGRGLGGGIGGQRGFRGARQ